LELGEAVEVDVEVELVKFPWQSWAKMPIERHLRMDEGAGPANRTFGVVEVVEMDIVVVVEMWMFQWRRCLDEMPIVLLKERLRNE
jgi:hypothetical protein